MGMSSGGTTEYNSEINVTPMVDVMLVLLIIFMVITPLLQSGVNLTLPKNLNPDLDPDIIKESAIVISVPDAGAYYFRKELYSGPGAKERLIERLKRAKKEQKPSDPPAIYIRGGINVPYKEIVTVVDSIREADFEIVGLVTDKKKPEK
jgi:biopolymer transport protein ExbD/biopolymer transport protein TolR